MNSKISVVRAIYLYLMCAASVLLLLFGLYGFISFIVKSTMLDQYPIQKYDLPYIGSYNNYNCSPSEVIDVNSGQISASSTDNCGSLTKEQEKENDRYRESKQVEDLTRSVFYLITGLLIFGFHWKLTKTLN